MSSSIEKDWGIKEWMKKQRNQEQKEKKKNLGCLLVVRFFFLPSHFVVGCKNEKKNAEKSRKCKMSCGWKLKCRQARDQN